MYTTPKLRLPVGGYLLVAAGIGLIVAGIAAALFESLVNTAVLVLLLVALVVVGGVAFAFQILTVSKTAVTLRWFPVYRTEIPLREITSVEVIEVRPLAYGGWGLRQFRNGVALVHAKGPGIRIARSIGSQTSIRKQYEFSTPNPEPVVSAINAARTAARSNGRKPLRRRMPGHPSPRTRRRFSPNSSCWR